ncbi:hypothetical protein M0804_008885 [Polistes exclamans]|nr:hypothetical protein M0804_008885 [Polistes exclamans]
MVLVKVVHCSNDDDDDQDDDLHLKYGGKNKFGIDDDHINDDYDDDYGYDDDESLKINLKVISHTQL